MGNFWQISNLFLNVFGFKKRLIYHSKINSYQLRGNFNLNLYISGTIFEQLKRRGFIPSASQKIITPPQHRKKLCKKNSNTKTTRSVEYVSNPTEKYYEKLKTFRGNLGSVNNGLKFTEYLTENSRLHSGYHDVKLRADPGRRMVKNGSIPSGRTRSYSSENIALNYEMFNDMGYPGVCNSKVGIQGVRVSL